MYIMDFKYKILISEFIIVIIGILITLKFKLFNGYMFLMMLFYIVITMAFFGFSSLKEYDLKNTNVYKEKERLAFDYSWAKANTLIRQIPGSEGLTWDEGLGVESGMKVLKNMEDKYEKFRYFLGYSTNDRKYMLIIYNCTTEDIADYIPDPSAEEQQDPWINFDPYGNNNNNQQLYGINPYDRRYGSRRPSSYNPPSNNDMNFSSSIDKARNQL